VTSVFDAVNHMATLRRGYALVRDGSGKPVFRASGLSAGAAIEIEFSDGRIRSRVGDEAPPAAETKPLPRRSRGKADPDDQGNLF
jgi:exodeoxyribonuclease VII large subunit